jgi:hypothetical protein
MNRLAQSCPMVDSRYGPPTSIDHRTSHKFWRLETPLQCPQYSPMKTIAEQLSGSPPGATPLTDPERALDYLEQQIPSLSAAAVDVAYWQALAAGQVVLVSGAGGIYQALPDGTRKLVKPMPEPLSVPVGTRVRIS